MSTNVPASFQSKYENNVEMVLQQQDSRILMAGAVDEQEDAGADKVKIRDLIGNTAPWEATDRHGDTQYNNTPHDGVWIAKPNELGFADLIDRADQLATAIDLTGAYTMAGAGTVGRARDQRILEGIFNPIISGKDGTTTTPFPNGNYVAVDAGSAAPTTMNVAKIRAATKMLLQNYADPNEPRFMVLTADDNDALLQEIPVASSDFARTYKGEVDDSGMLRSLMGWRFIHMELDNPLLGTVMTLATDGSGYRLNPFWTKSGIRVNWWSRLFTGVDRLPTKRYTTQVFASTILAATRTQAGKVGLIRNVKG